MAKKDRLQGKRILIVDDEPDVLETLAELLSMCDVVEASSFGAAEKAMNDDHFDIAVLDIMGVDGYKLLEIANKKKVTAVMLTANALSVEETKKSYLSGAALYIPKGEMENIVTLLNDVLEGREKGKSTWHRWWDRLGWYYDNRFGPDWKYSDKEFWDTILKKGNENREPPGNP
ncbi:MAG: response regulator [Deltaproteobacteria bacterium]|nr:response regulator [Deltaproteobacteria bacterium]